MHSKHASPNAETMSWSNLTPVNEHDNQLFYKAKSIPPSARKILNYKKNLGPTFTSKPENCKVPLPDTIHHGLKTLIYPCLTKTD